MRLGDDAVRTLELEGERQAGDGLGLDVAQQRRQEDDLARAVDAALGGREEIERTRRRPAFDAAVGQVEGGLCDIEEGVVAGCGLDGDELRRAAAGAAGEARGEVGAAVGVGGGFAEDFVVDRDQADGGALDRLGRGQRADEGVDAVVAVDRGRAEIGDDEPLGGESTPSSPGSRWRPWR